MKFLSPVLCVIFISAFTTALPIDEDEERFVWFPDSNGTLHFIDLWDDSEPESKYDPEDHIRYLLYTRQNPDKYQEIIKGDVESLFDSNFNGENPVVFTIHGWTSGEGASTNYMIRNAYLSVDDVNVISVDWNIGAAPGYVRAVRNVLRSGPSVAEFIDWLNEVGGAQFSKMHLTGHSLGGQMTGIIGRKCTRRVIEYITALDPAYPLWGKRSQRVRKTDGKYVEVIHTNSRILGMREAVGHNDFYPNGGTHMPGCGLDIRCSHNMCINYLAESIISGGFTSVECITVSEAHFGVQNCTGSRKMHLGGSRIKSEIGILALDTNGKSPFSQG